MNNKAWLTDIINKAKSGEYREGVYHTHPNEQGFAIVIGWQDGYEKDKDLTQQEDGGEIWTLCGKVAYNCDDLQCDYDYDWYMPSDKEGDIYDTSIAIHSVEDIDYLTDELDYVSREYDKHNLFKGDK